MIKKDTFTFMYVLFRIEISTDSLTNKRGHKLHCHYWKVGRSSYHLERNVLYSKLLYLFQCHRPKCLVFLSHGFSEHLGLYNEIGKLLGNRKSFYSF